MNKKTLIISGSLLTLLMGGCTIPSEQPADQQAQTPPTPATSPDKKPQDFAKPVVPEKSTVNVSGLIPETPPNSVTPVVGRPDPFALIPVKPKISIDTEKAKAKLGNKTVSGSSGEIPPIPNPPVEKVPNAPTGERQIPSLPNPNLPGVPVTNNGSGFSPSLPQIPTPSLAKEVSVTGVIEVAGVPQVILQAPGEPSSRYVRAGDYISNGQVLVKRVEMNRGSVPVVVLEQFGIEVTKQVGQKPEPPADKPPTSTASVREIPSFPNS